MIVIDMLIIALLVLDIVENVKTRADLKKSTEQTIELRQLIELLNRNLG